MFSRASDASKVAFVRLAELMDRWEFPLIDCQIPNPHLSSLGVVEIPRAEFLRYVEQFGQPPDRGANGAFSRLWHGPSGTRENAVLITLVPWT